MKELMTPANHTFTETSVKMAIMCYGFDQQQHSERVNARSCTAVSEYI